MPFVGPVTARVDADDVITNTIVAALVGYVVGVLLGIFPAIRAKQSEGYVDEVVQINSMTKRQKKLALKLAVINLMIGLVLLFVLCLFIDGRDVKDWKFCWNYNKDRTKIDYYIGEKCHDSLPSGTTVVHNVENLKALAYQFFITKGQAGTYVCLFWIFFACGIINGAKAVHPSYRTEVDAIGQFIALGAIFPAVATRSSSHRVHWGFPGNFTKGNLTFFQWMVAIALALFIIYLGIIAIRTFKPHLLGDTKGKIGLYGFYFFSAAGFALWICAFISAGPIVGPFYALLGIGNVAVSTVHLYLREGSSSSYESMTAPQGILFDTE